MIVLGIETATEHLGAALFVENKNTYERYINSRSSHCELLSEFIQELADEADIFMDSLDFIAVSEGPGSFTGLRIGIATAMGLAYGLRIATCGINTLMSIASNVAAPGTLVCPLIDAKRSEVYTALYRTDNDIPHAIINPLALPVSELVNMLKKRNEPVTITGPAQEKFKNMLQESLGSSISFSPPDLAIPSAKSIAKLGLKIFRSGGGENPALLKPVYLRRSDAEISRDLSNFCN